MDELQPLRRAPLEETVKIRAIAKRVAKRNEGKDVWPEDGRSLRGVAHERHRF